MANAREHRGLVSVSLWQQNSAAPAEPDDDVTELKRR